jgi:hypothetical protein
METDVSFYEWFASCYKIMIEEDRYRWFGGNYIAVASSEFDEDMMHIMDDFVSDDISSESSKKYLINHEQTGDVIIGYGSTLSETIKMIDDKAHKQRKLILDKMDT